MPHNGYENLENEVVEGENIPASQRPSDPPKASTPLKDGQPKPVSPVNGASKSLDGSDTKLDTAKVAEQAAKRQAQLHVIVVAMTIFSALVTLALAIAIVVGEPEPGKAVGVPGELHGMLLAHSQFGKIPWSQLVEPAIQLAKKGVAMDKEYIDNLQRRVELGELPAKPEGKESKSRERFREIYMNGVSADELKVGDVVKNSRLETILAKVRDNPYTVLQCMEHYIMPIINSVKENGGTMSPEDMSQYFVDTNRTLLNFTYSGYNILTMGAPSGGPLVLRAFRKFVEWYDNALVEHGVKGTREMEFDQWTKLNSYRPGMRPQSSMAPTVFLHTAKSCKKRGALGAINGTRIVGAVAQVLASLLVENETPQMAVHSPRAACDDQGIKCVPQPTTTESGHVALVLKEATNVFAADDYNENDVNGTSVVI